MPELSITMSAMASRLFTGRLGGHPGAGLVLRQAAAREPGHLHILRHVDDDDHVEVRAALALGEQRDVVHDDRVRAARP